MFNPVNRYIQVRYEEQNPAENKSGIVLPADYAPVKEKYIAAEVVSWAADVRFINDLRFDSKVIIDQSMIEEIIVNKEKITVILDNYVIGIVE